MEINLNKSTKRALSLVLAFAVLIGSLFTANIGVNITADAATTDLGTVWYYSGIPASKIADDTSATDETKGTAENPIIINSAEELAYLAKTAGTATNGLYYELGDVDTIIMQPESVAKTDKDGNGVYDILEIESGEKANTYLAGLSGVVNWVCNGGGTNPFGGIFNGNGAAIYGMYYGTGDWICSGLFPNVSGGATIKNVAVRNSVLLTQNYTGALIGYSPTADTTITIDSCEVSNCWIYHTNTEEGKEKYTTNGFASRTGVVVGTIGAYLNINNCIVYGSKASSSTFTMGIFGMVKNSAGNSYTNLIVLDTAPYTKIDANSTDINNCTFENIYTNDSLNDGYHTKSNSNYYAGYIIPIDADSAKGSLGKLTMDLDWATNEQDATWYAIDGEYPTLFKPEGWTDCETITPWTGEAAASFAADADGNYGDGTAEAPYLIETPEQLWAMVKAGGKQTDGTPAYYKVKDGVTDLYLSRAISGGYAAVVSLAGGTAGTDYYNWNTGAWTVFEGNFDGNGVTIRGMISKSTDNFKQVGLVGVFGEDAVVKNINFDTCYAHNTHANNSALLASQVIGYQDENKDGVSTNCKYCITYKETGSYCVKHGNSSSDTSDCGGTVCQYSDDTVNCETHNGGAKDGYNLIYNVSVRNSSIKSSSGTCCAGIVVSYNGAPDMLQIVNCLYDGYSCELGNGTTDGSNNNAGIAAYSWGINNFQASGCISLNAPLAQETSSAADQYNDYTTGTGSDHPVYTYNCYTNIAKKEDSTIIAATAINADSKAADYYSNMPLIDWANGWQIVTDDSGREVPMPRVRTAADVVGTWDTGEVVLDYNRWLATAEGSISTAPYLGKNGYFEKFTGSGTKDDPYLISTALELARAIGAGGTKLNNKLYFKLSNDIDVSGMSWLNTVGSRPTNASDSNTHYRYTYVPFVGVLDGDGHTITGLYAVNGNQDQQAYTADWQAGLIPVLDGGEVKNLHIRNSYAASGTGYENTTGVLVGEVKSGTISGCSVEGANGSTTLVGVNGGSQNIKNSYIGDTYYNASGAEVTANSITVDYGTGAENPVWYKGGAEGSVPRLVNRAAAMTEVDVAGDDNTDYGTEDLAALRNKLLRKSAYQNIYGDVSKNGVVNSSDLVILRRAMATDYEDIQDGFWRNVECGQIAIYYSENDTQDMARKLELYFESEVQGLDMMKYATKLATAEDEDGVTDSSLTSEDIKAAPEENAIIITQGDPTSVAYNEYSVTYDSENNLVTIYGGSFTAVEQAVIYFMANSSRATGDVYTIANGDILNEKLTDIKITNAENEDSSDDITDELLVATETESAEYSYKQSVTVGGIPYYYAWGDEFEGNSNTISSDNWGIKSYRGENSDPNTTSQYTNQENANLSQLNQLWVCTDGRLQIWRGVNTDAYSALGLTDNYSWGYKGLSLGTSGKNDWRKELDANDVFIDPGLITTQNSMLFKQGYVEMEASLPSDGHAFPAWWFLTYTGDTNNNTIANSLYGKVFKETGTWDGTATINGANPNTYKYQLPSAHLEFDIVETMQQAYGATDDTAYKYPTGSGTSIFGAGTDYQTEVDTYNHYKRDFNLTVHKIYNENAVGDNLYILDWSKTGIDRIVATYQDTDSSAENYFTTSSTAGTTWIHRYDGSEYGYTLGNTNGLLFSSGLEVGSAYNMARKMTGTVKYGFSWSVDVTDGTYAVKVYVDIDGDGSMSETEMVMAVHEKTGHESKYGTDPIYNSSDTTADAEIWNQYAYMLLDNGFYTSSSGKSDDKNVQFIDLLTQDRTGSTDYNSYANYYIDDKTTFEINYVRVYQQDGKRDIVTNETENFNNGNHFGYGE